MLGHEGLGELSFSKFLAKSFLCLTYEEITRSAACLCPSCRVFNSGNPDFLLVEPREDGKQITVDQIRNVSHFFTLKAHYEGQKICVICLAESMNTNASNALLKILEEPPQDALIILITHSIGLITPTVRSRCQLLKITEAGEEEVISLLSEGEKSSVSLERKNISCYGGPLIVQGQLKPSSKELDSLVEDLHELAIGKGCPISSAKKYSDWKVQEFFTSLELLSRHLILISYGHELKNLYLSNTAKDFFSALRKAVPSQFVFELIACIKTQRDLSRRSAGVRFVDAVETVFVFWVSKTRIK
jgi:hypothetical protein